MSDSCEIVTLLGGPCDGMRVRVPTESWAISYPYLYSREEISRVEAKWHEEDESPPLEDIRCALYEKQMDGTWRYKR
jgi:hypothetical protein